MKNILYTSAEELSVGGARGRFTVSKTETGIAVKTESLYSEEQDRIMYYHDGEYPTIPEDWNEKINDYGTSAADAWAHNLKSFNPYRTVNC